MQRPKILVVDDDPDLVRALRLRLRANNYEVATAKDGYSAIATAQKERPALIILDLGLPVGDGFVVLDRLQNIDALAGVPVIVLSARDPQMNEQRALKAGARGFIGHLLFSLLLRVPRRGHLLSPACSDGKQRCFRHCERKRSNPV